MCFDDFITEAKKCLHNNHCAVTHKSSESAEKKSSNDKAWNMTIPSMLPQTKGK